MPFPNFDPVLVHLGPFAIRWYALAYIAGFLFGWRYAVSLSRTPKIWLGGRPTLDQPLIDDIILWIILAILVGGRLGSVFFYNPGILTTDPLEVVKVWHGGMSFHGALIAVGMALWLFASRHRLSLLRVADMTAPCVPFGLFFGRLANFINGELWGRPTTLPWGVIFPRAGPEPRHPSELYEAALEGVVLFLILRWATHGAKLLPRKGAVTGLFLTFYALFRILLENVREPDRGMPNFPFGLTMGMILSLPMLALGLALLYFASRPSAILDVARTEEAPPAPAVDDTVKDVPEVAADLAPPTTEDPEAARGAARP